jgi:hypothetical protein
MTRHTTIDDLPVLARELPQEEASKVLGGVTLASVMQSGQTDFGLDASSGYTDQMTEPGKDTTGCTGPVDTY